MGHSDIEVQDMEALWNILDNGDGELSVDEFLMGVARIKGPSKSLDTVHVLHLCQRMEKKVDAILEERKPAAARSPSVTLKPLPVVALLKEETCESMSI
ncbi:unnamed protein product [Polarella glacialis]|uniref:EF-hand domain-containing protein n=1 Tax=Polarella glacialis TaxID=89957 RepID=A0A813GLV5_POLGL|nr:unnamed protein product [Polarella glacialis]